MTEKMTDTADTNEDSPPQTDGLSSSKGLFKKSPYPPLQKGVIIRDRHRDNGVFK